MKNSSDNNCDFYISQTGRQTNNGNYCGYSLAIIMYLYNVNQDRQIYIDI